MNTIRRNLRQKLLLTLSFSDICQITSIFTFKISTDPNYNRNHFLTAHEDSPIQKAAKLPSL